MEERFLISRAELSRRLGVSKTMVTKYCAKGLPVTLEGGVIWPDAKYWIAKNIRPHHEFHRHPVPLGPLAPAVDGDAKA